MNVLYRRACALLTCLVAFGIAGFASAQTQFPPAFNNQATFEPGDLVTDYGNIYRCLVAVTKPYQDPSKYYKEWQLYYVRNNTTLSIGPGQTFPTLATAWTYIQNCHVADGAYLHLSISTTNGELIENFSAPFLLDQISGSSISIIGDNAQRIFLGFPNGNGLTIDTGHTLSISNVTITGVTGNFYSGISASTNASISLTGINIAIFDVGLQASQGANITVDATSNISLCDDDAALSYTGANITFGLGWTCTDNAKNAVLEASNGGLITAPGCSLDGNGSTGSGVRADFGGNISLVGFAGRSGPTIINCEWAIVANERSYIWADNATFSGIAMTELNANGGGFVRAENLGFTATHSTDSGVGSVIEQSI